LVVTSQVGAGLGLFQNLIDQGGRLIALLDRPERAESRPQGTYGLELFWRSVNDAGVGIAGQEVVQIDECYERVAFEADGVDQGR
jgi:hypothetical protein